MLRRVKAHSADGARVSSAGVAETQHLIHAVKTGGLAGGPDGGVQGAIDEAREFQNKASFYLDYVYSENSYGFHAPAYIQRILADSLDASRKGQLVLSGVDVTTLEPSDISAENEKKSEERGA